MQRAGRPPSRAAAVAGLLLGALVLGAFAGVARNDFVPFDDDLYITRNPAVLGGLTRAGLAWAVTSLGYASNWHPLTWLSHMADVQLFGLDPGRHHLTSLLFHLASSLLLFLVLRTATGRAWRSFFAAGLFAAHPLRVESVAWAAERKDVLAFFFAMLALGAWVAWLRRPASRGRFALAAAFLAAGLLAKPSLLAVPLALAVLNRWPLGSSWRGGGPAPGGALARADRGAALLLVPAVAAGSLALLAQRAGGGLLDEAAPALGMRLANALISCAAYLGRTALPHDLAVFYPFPASIPAGEAIAAAAVLAAISAAAWVARGRHPALLAGWLWYLITLLPAAGIVPLGAQAMADRYSYLPSVGLAVAAAWTVAALAEKSAAARTAAAAAGAASLVALLALTRAQVAVWRDGSTLFTHALAATRENWLIEHELGVLHFNAKRYPQAERHLREAVRIQPDFVMAHFHLAGALFWQERTEEAIAEYREAVRLRPDFTEGRVRLARALGFAGRWQEALEGYEAALRIDPANAAAVEGRRRALAALGR